MKLFKYTSQIIAISSLILAIGLSILFNKYIAESEKLKVETFDLKNKLSELNSEIKLDDLSINSLNGQIIELNRKIEEVSAKQESIEGNLYEYNYTIIENESNTRKLMTILYKFPQISKKLAFVKQSTVNDDLINITFDYVEWISGEDGIKAAIEDNKREEANEGNGGYYIRNRQEERDEIRLDRDTLIYTLNGASVQYVEYSSFLNDPSSLLGKLFHLYLIENRVLILEEQYRP